MGEGLIVRRGGGVGSAEGLNVWSKHIYLPEVTFTNPSLKLTAPSSSGKACLISDENFDLMRVNDYLTFFDGFKSTSSIVNNLVNTGTYLKWTNATVYARLGKFDPVNKQFTLSFDSSTFNNMVRTFVFDGDKTISASGGDIVGFVVNDDPNAYPNGAVHTDGYWYELLGQVASANVMSLSNNALETVQSDYREQIVSEVSQS